ncbi:PDZ domain-containing protein [Eggerthellaceae bacterium zg-1084]|uniref:S1C family serine protease n=1 Tax=Berryella wangjianweii TaxID=2734634 RepID=UPI0015562940|nr:trypsin-like peptidase domain-containing protein [Berryella wangjianweii]NPD30522.1 PDZ domain-containing protein [Berryella wangjianweii]
MTDRSNPLDPGAQPAPTDPRPDAPADVAHAGAASAASSGDQPVAAQAGAAVPASERSVVEPPRFQRPVAPASFAPSAAAASPSGAGAAPHAPRADAQPGHASQAATSGHAGGHAGGFAPAPAASASAPRKDHVFAKAFGGAALAVCLGLGGFATYQGVTGANAGKKVTVGSTQPSTINAKDTDGSLAEAVAEKGLKSVVCVYVYSSANASPFGANGPNGSNLNQSSLGSGVILSADGYVLTNNHVVQGSQSLKVNVGGTEYDADLVGSDPSSDVAVIKLRNATDLVPADIGDSSNLTVGQWVMTIGAPFGLEQSVATGVVSATSRSQIVPAQEDEGYGPRGRTRGSDTIYPNMIQTDAAINPGNSGGALVDANGKVIGINTLIKSYSGNYSGVGFAIPINYAVNIANQIIEGKVPTHARLGASLSTVNGGIAKRFGLSATSGAYVASVAPGSGAAEAGLEEGDIVTAFNGKPITDASSLLLAVRGQMPGDVVKVTVNRDGVEKEFDVKLGSDGDAANTAPARRSGYETQG